MATPSTTDLEVLRRLAQTPEGRLLVQVFQSRLADLDKSNRRAIGDNLVRGQGRSLELEEILTELFGVEEIGPLPTRPKPQPNRAPTLDRFMVNHMAVRND